MHASCKIKMALKIRIMYTFTILHIVYTKYTLVLKDVIYVLQECTYVRRLFATLNVCQ